jgi:hypothetical protein
VYVPASGHYLPTLAGTVNRINAAGAVGIAMVLYAAVVLLLRMLSRLLRLPAAVTSIAGAALTLTLLGAYLERAADDARQWDRAAADQRAELADLHAVLPRPPSDATLYVFDAPQAVGPGVPVLNTLLDLTSALRLSYSSPRLVGVPLDGPGNLTCEARGPLAAGAGGAYGDSYLVDVGRRSVARLTAPRQCAELLRAPPTATRKPGRV